MKSITNTLPTAYPADNAKAILMRSFQFLLSNIYPANGSARNGLIIANPIIAVVSFSDTEVM